MRHVDVTEEYLLYHRVVGRGDKRQLNLYSGGNGNVHGEMGNMSEIRWLEVVLGCVSL